MAHVVRIRASWDLANRRWPSAPFPTGDIKAGAAGLVIPPPRSLRAVDVDLYVCARRPYWPHEAKARRNNACIGPLKNEAGQYVTGVAIHRSVVSEPTPAAAVASPPLSDEDRLRGLGVTLDERGFVWVVEQWMSRATFDDPDSAPEV